MKVALLITILGLASLANLRAQSEFTIDQTKTVHAQSAVAEAEAQLKAQGSTFLVNALTIDKPLDLEAFANEYRANGGGPVSALFGISPFQVQNGLVRAFSGLLLLIFCGIAVMRGMQKGELNLLPLAGKLFLGIIILWHPDYVYAAGRIIQTTGLYMTKAAMESESASSLRDAIKASDMTTLSAAAVESRAMDQGAGNVSPHAFYRVYSAVDAYNRNYGSGAGVGIPINEKDSEADKMRALNSILNTSRFRDAITNMEPFKTQFEDARKKHEAAVQKVGEGSSTVSFLNKSYYDEIEKIATEAGEKLFGISAADKAWNGALAKPGEWIDKVVENVAGFIGSLIIPIAVWILIKGSAMFLELTLIVICVTFPLCMLEETQKAFFGTVRAFFACAVVPSVGYVLLSIFEAFAAFVFKVAAIGAIASALPTGFGGTVGVTAGYIVFWIVGVGVIIWKTPKISRAILEGGSVVASIASVGLASMAAGVFTAAGVSTTLTGLSAGGATAGGTGSQMGLKGVESAGKAMDAGAKALDPDTPTASSGRAGSSSTQEKSGLNSTASTDRKARAMEEKMAQKQARADSEKLSPEMKAGLSSQASPQPTKQAKPSRWKYEGPPIVASTAQILQVAVKAGAVGVLSGGSIKSAVQILAAQRAAAVAKNASKQK